MNYDSASECGTSHVINVAVTCNIASNLATCAMGHSKRPINCQLWSKYQSPVLQNKPKLHRTLLIRLLVLILSPNYNYSLSVFITTSYTTNKCNVAVMYLQLCSVTHDDTPNVRVHITTPCVSCLYARAVIL